MRYECVVSVDKSRASVFYSGHKIRDIPHIDLYLTFRSSFILRNEFVFSSRDFDPIHSNDLVKCLFCIRWLNSIDHHLGVDHEP